MKKKVLVVVLLVVVAFIIGMGEISALVTTAPKTTSSIPEANKNYRMAMKVIGQKSGKLGDNIRVLAVSHNIVSPRDAATGLPTGQRMHKPFVITKEVDKTSPLFESILCTNENLPEVSLTFSTGNPADNYTVKLTNANIVSVDLREALTSNGLATEEVAFTYQKITWTYAKGAMATDDWQTNM